MIKRVNPQVDFIAIEHEVLAFWEEKNIFQKEEMPMKAILNGHL